MMDGKRADDEVERAARQRVFEARQPHVRVRKRGTRSFEHLGAGVDRDELRLRMAGEHAARRLACADPELEDLARRRAGRGGGLLLQFVVCRDLVEHVREIGLGIPVPLRHGTTLGWAG